MLLHSFGFLPGIMAGYFNCLHELHTYFIFYDLHSLHNHLQIIGNELKVMGNTTAVACFQASTQHWPESTGKNRNPSTQYLTQTCPKLTQY